jgi:Flp pilus assembly pilin Flp
MDDSCTGRLSAAIEQMQGAGYSDAKTVCRASSYRVWAQLATTFSASVRLAYLDGKFGWGAKSLAERGIGSIQASAWHPVHREAESSAKEIIMSSFLAQLWANDQGQDIAEYAVMLAVILVIVVGTIRLIGSNANSVFSQAASSIQ